MLGNEQLIHVSYRRVSRGTIVTWALFSWPMLGMHVVADVFKASCNVEPTGCTVAWLLLVLSTMVHVVRCVYCGDDNCESDDDVGPETMYS